LASASGVGQREDAAYGRSFFEKSDTFNNGGRRVQRVNEVLPPLAGTKTDSQIVVDIMYRMGIPQPDCAHDGVLAVIARVVPPSATAARAPQSSTPKSSSATSASSRGWSLVPHHSKSRVHPHLIREPQLAPISTSLAETLSLSFTARCRSPRTSPPRRNTAGFF
jgi:hypothetical protein